VHLPARTDDGIDRAGRQALGAADAGFLIDLCDERRSLGAVGRVEREDRPFEQRGERRDRGGTARRTLVDLSLTGGNGLRIGTAAVVATARALRLWQQRVDVVHGGHAGHFQVIFMPGVAPESGASR